MIGFGPDQVDRWEPYQIMAVYTGYRAASTPPAKASPSDEEFRRAVAATVH